MISWKAVQSPNPRPWWADNQQRAADWPLSRMKTPPKRSISIISRVYTLHHSFIIIFLFLHRVFLLFLYIVSVPLTPLYASDTRVVTRVSRARTCWFIIVLDIILIRCKLLGCIMYVCHLFPPLSFVVFSRVFLLARRGEDTHRYLKYIREQISDY